MRGLWRLQARLLRGPLLEVIRIAVFIAVGWACLLSYRAITRGVTSADIHGIQYIVVLVAGFGLFLYPYAMLGPLQSLEPVSLTAPVSRFDRLIVQMIPHFVFAPLVGGLVALCSYPWAQWELRGAAMQAFNASLTALVGSIGLRILLAYEGTWGRIERFLIAVFVLLLHAGLVALQLFQPGLGGLWVFLLAGAVLSPQWLWRVLKDAELLPSPGAEPSTQSAELPALAPLRPLHDLPSSPLGATSMGPAVSTPAVKRTVAPLTNTDGKRIQLPFTARWPELVMLRAAYFSYWHVSLRTIVTMLMTLTTPACPVGPFIQQEITDAMRELGFSAVETELTFDPPWKPPQALRDALGV